MALSLGDYRTDFDGRNTEGRIRFHDWIGDKWAVLFRPKDFTPVCCTTETRLHAKIKTGSIEAGLG